MSNSSNQAIKVAIVDDSAFIRMLLKECLSAEPDIEIVGEAGDPFEAREMIKRANPDLITLDIEMPRMNGIEFLEKIMTLRPMPVIMFSSLTQKNAEETIRALEIGAVDTVAKPQTGDAAEVIRAELIPKIRAVRHQTFFDLGMPLSPPPYPSSSSRSGVRETGRAVEKSLLGIASSTGGIERLRYMFAGLYCHIPPTLVVQHINQHYIDSLASRLRSLTPEHIEVKVAEHNEFLNPDTIYIADNIRHLLVKKSGDRYRSVLHDAPPRNGFIASADYLFESIAENDGDNSAGIILSGMGNDGAEGLLRLHKAGGLTIGESSESCLVYGMPKAAADLDALTYSMSLRKITEYINDSL